MRLPLAVQRLRQENLDSWFIGAVVVLCLLGTVAVYGAGSFTSDSLGQYYYLRQHLQRLVIGVLAALALACVDHVRLQRGWLVWSALAGCLLVTALPVVFGSAGIDRWVTIRGVGQFQPLELAKLALVMFLAHRLAAPRLDHPLGARQLGITLAAGPLALMVLLALQPNFGNMVVIAIVTCGLLVLAGVRWRYLLAVPAGGAVLAVAGYLCVNKLHVRIEQWRYGWLGRGLGDEPPFGYQVHQALLGMGAGGWRGLLPGNSHNKFAFLPEHHTDFAVSFLGEELGLLGTLTVVTALLVLLWRALVIAERAPTRCGQLLAAGLGLMLFTYGAVNIAMVTGMIPVMGVPLPFISYGGSALVTNLAAVGIILNVDRQGRRRRQQSPVRHSLV